MRKEKENFHSKKEITNTDKYKKE